MYVGIFRSERKDGPAMMSWEIDIENLVGTRIASRDTLFKRKFHIIRLFTLQIGANRFRSSTPGHAYGNERNLF